MEDRKYQTEAIRFLSNTKRGILEAPAGAGKTYVTACALSQCLDGREGIASVEIMVNTREQVDQFEAACGLFPVIAQRANLSIFCGAGAPLGSLPDLLIVDECHHSASKTWARKIKEAPKARWGLSATPFSSNGFRNERMVELFGHRHYDIPREGLVDAGHLARAKVVWHTIEGQAVTRNIEDLKQEMVQKAMRDSPHMFKHPRTADKYVRRIEWRAVQKAGLFQNEPRNAIIVEEANTRIRDGHSVIILIGKITHGEELAEQIEGAVQCNSRLGKKTRRETIEAFRNGGIRCLIATSMLDEGFDAPVASCLIVASGGKSERKAIQSTGRVLRPYDGKAHGVIVDFQDDFHPMISWHSEERFNTYAELNYQQSDPQ